MAVEVFVDESMRQDYLFGVVTVDTDELAAKRRALRRMLLPGERRMHFSKETDPRRRKLLSLFSQEGFSATVFTCRAPDTVARGLLLTAIVERSGSDLRRLTIEARDAENLYDVRHLVGLRSAGVLSRGARFHHVQARHEPLLWVADGVAWAWGAGGDWRRRAAPITDGVVRVEP